MPAPPPVLVLGEHPYHRQQQEDVERRWQGARGGRPERNAASQVEAAGQSGEPPGLRLPTEGFPARFVADHVADAHHQATEQADRSGAAERAERSRPDGHRPRQAGEEPDQQPPHRIQRAGRGPRREMRQQLLRGHAGKRRPAHRRQIQRHRKQEQEHADLTLRREPAREGILLDHDVGLASLVERVHFPMREEKEFPVLFRSARPPLAVVPHGSSSRRTVSASAPRDGGSADQPPIFSASCRTSARRP